MAARIGSAKWQGTLKEGEGTVTIGQGGLSAPYTFDSRFGEGTAGANPEELIAAAHAACFSMALNNALHLHEHGPVSIETTARAHIRQIDEKPTIAKIELECVGDVPGIDEAHFIEHAEEAKENCIISRALSVPEIELTARLAN